MSARTMAICSIIMGGCAVLIAFAPLLPLQAAGAVIGGVGVWWARRAQRADYRLDTLCLAGKISSITGIVVCLLGPVLFLVGTVIKAIG